MRRASEPAGVTVAATAARDPRTPVDGLNLTAAGVAGRPGAPGAGDTRRARPAWLERLTSVWFVGPAVLVLLTLVAYPIVYTVWLSLHASDGSTFVGLDNYVRMFTAPETRQAIVNNVVWVAVAPTLVTAIGLVLAVLIERVRLSTVFKAVVFMPMAISFLAAGVTFRMVYDESPDRGVLNAAVVAVHDAFSPPSAYYGARPREGTAPTEVAGAVEIAANTGAPVLLPLVGLPQDRIPAEATAAQTPTATGLSGVVWLDFTPVEAGPPARWTPPNAACRPCWCRPCATARWWPRPAPARTEASRSASSRPGRTRCGWPRRTSPRRSTGSPGWGRRWSHRRSSWRTSGSGPGSPWS
ncbi:carbohydrate ABC transporter permease [Catellatospora coxensis]